MKSPIFLFKTHVFVFRNEYMFLPYDYGADPYREYDEFVKLGADGFFTDFPWSLSNYLNLTGKTTQRGRKCSNN